MKRFVCALWATFVLGLAAPSAVQAATTWYFNDCQAGSSFDCVPGSESNDGLTAATPKLLLNTYTTKWNACQAGDSFLFGGGSSFIGTATPSAGNQLYYLDCRNSTIAAPVTMGMYTPSYQARCTGTNNGGTVTYGAGTMTDTSKNGVWTTDQFRDCDVEVAEVVEGIAHQTQRFTIAGNSTAGVLTLATYRQGDLTATNDWSYRPAAGATYTILPKQPLLSRTQPSSPYSMMLFADTGQTFDHKGINVRDIHVEGGAFTRAISSATNTTNAVLTDPGLGSVGGVATNALVGRLLFISYGTCYNANQDYTITANDATTITLSGVIASGSCTPDSTSRYHVRGNTWGIYMLAYNRSVNIDKVNLQHLSIALSCAGKAANPTSRDWTITNSQIMYNVMGSLMGCDNVLFEGDIFFHNGLTLGDHHIYLTDSNSVYGEQQVYVRHNRFSYGDQGARGWCTGAQVIKHGLGSGFFLEYNVFEEDDNSIGQCWAIGWDSGVYGFHEGFKNITMRGNTFKGFPQAIGTDITDGVTIENNNIRQLSGTGIRFRDKVFQQVDSQPSGTITLTATTGSITVTTTGNFNSYNNGQVLYAGTGSAVMTWVNSTTMTGLVTSAFSTTTYTSGNWGIRNTNPKNVRVRNNLVYLTNPTAGAVGIQMARHPNDPPSAGGHEVVSNIVIFGAGATSTSSCFNTDQLVSTDFAAFDKNHCWAESGGTPKWNSTTGTGTLADAIAAGYDAGSSFSDPGVTFGGAPGYRGTITSGSAAYNTGHATKSSPITFDGKKRAGVTGAPSKGPHEPNATVILPGTPTKIRVTQ